MQEAAREGPRSAPGKERPAPSASGAPFSGIRVGSFAGFQITLDYSWFVIFFLIFGTFAGAILPAHAPGLEYPTYLILGFAGTVLFFVSLLGHELAHAFVARSKGIEVEGITLFIFGGMARTRSEAVTPGDEFQIAGVGPLASFAFAAIFYLAALVGTGQGLHGGMVVLAEYLAFLNFLLAIFNLLPGFPLDGGRLLRAAIWRITGSLRHATRVATTAGRGLGFGIIGLGIFAILAGGAFVGGLWFIFVGWFLSHAAGASYQQLLLRDVLGHLSARDAMTPDPETVGPDLPVERLVREFFLARPYNSFPVTQDGVVVGLVTLSQVKETPWEEWEGRVVADIMTSLSEVVVVEPETPMLEVLERLGEGDQRRILVAQEWELVGILSTTDVTRWLDRATLMEHSPPMPNDRSRESPDTTLSGRLS